MLLNNGMIATCRPRRYVIMPLIKDIDVVN